MTSKIFTMIKRLFNLVKKFSTDSFNKFCFCMKWSSFWKNPPYTTWFENFFWKKIVGSTCRIWNRVSICQQGDMKTIFGDTHFFPHQLIANVLLHYFSLNFPLWGQFKEQFFSRPFRRNLSNDSSLPPPPWNSPPSYILFLI